MINRSNRFLRQEANDGGEGGGAAPVTGAAATAEPQSGADAEQPKADTNEPEGQQPEAKKPGLLDSVLGSIQSKGALVAELNEARTALEAERGTVANLRTEIADLKGELARASLELEGLRTERAQIEAALEKSKAEATTTEQKAADIVAGLGVPAAKVPAAESEEDSEEGLRARLQACSDPQERFRIAQKLRELRWN